MSDYYQFEFKCRKCGIKFKYHKLRECPKWGSFGIKLLEEVKKMGEEEKEEKKKKKSTIKSVMGVPIEHIKSISGVPIENIASINRVPVKHKKEKEEKEE